MKRLFLAFAMIVGISAVGVCQNVNVNVNGSNNYRDGYKYINGVCSCDDIGGVEVRYGEDTATFDDVEYTYGEARFFNRNNFRVTVVYEIVMQINDGYKTRTGNIVIEPNSSSNVYLEYFVNGFKDFNVTGLIVRKLVE